MTTLLALTVGGSCVPIVTAIQDHEPDLVCFFATAGPRGSRMTVDGTGKPCGRDPDREPSIVAQLDLLPDRYRIVELEEPDDLAYIYTRCYDVLRELAVEHPQAHYIADYTGGTKSMSVGLALAALESGWSFSLVKGMRTDLVQVANGTEMASLVNAWEVRARQRMEEARRLFNAFAYASAGELLEDLVRQNPLSPRLDRTIRSWVTYCRGFDAWDRFDHTWAAQLLSSVPGHGISWPFLKALTGQIRTSGYEPVLDLVLNAERRAGRGRFDDAVARLYRAIELLAQIRLQARTPSLDSSDLDVARLPEALQAKYERLRPDDTPAGEKAKIQLGLVKDYVLLQDLGDPLGSVYASLEGRLRHALTKRNHSILAHGLTPLTKEDYQMVWDVAKVLLTEGLAALGVDWQACQFPLLMPEGLAFREESS
jgi:CRISPR-associated protein (TIGR02710 family)